MKVVASRNFAFRIDAETKLEFPMGQVVNVDDKYRPLVMAYVGGQLEILQDTPKAVQQRAELKERRRVQDLADEKKLQQIKGKEAERAAAKRIQKLEAEEAERTKRLKQLEAEESGRTERIKKLEAEEAERTKRL